MTWLPLAHEDPVPGDHFATAELGTYFSDEAVKLRNIVAELARLDAGSWEGDAADRFRGRRSKVIPHLEAIAKRWDGAAQALKAWAQEMDSAQTLARRARDDARFADDQRADAQAKLDAARAEFRENFISSIPEWSVGVPGPEPDPMIPWLEREVDGREADLAAARALLGQAEELYDTGARRCEGALDSASDDTLENHHGIIPGLRRGIHGVVKRFPQIKTAAKWIGLAAGALAITASMFTGVGELATLAFVAGGLATALDTTLAISGDGKWTTAAWDAFGLLTFGLGRAYASAARGTAAASGLEATKGTAAMPLKEVITEGKAAVGAAARTPLAEVANEWKGFASEASTGILPEGRNWLRAVTFWREIEIPPPEVLRLSSEARRYAATAQVLEGLTRGNDIRGVIASEQELLANESE